MLISQEIMAFLSDIKKAGQRQLKERLGRRLEPYVATAETVLNTDRLRQYRRWVDLPALNKQLLRQEFEKKVTRVRSYPEEITLATTIRCNKQPPCAICERNLRTTDLEWDVPSIVLDRLKPVFPHLEILYLHCSGEPLFYKRFGELLTMVKPPTRIRFNSNAVLLTKDKIKAIMDSEVVDVINFSLDAATESTYRKIRGPGFDKVVQNITALSAEKKARGSSIPFIVVNMCITKANYRELVQFVELAARMGAGAVDLFHMNKGLDWKVERPDGFVFDYQDQENMDPDEHDAMIVRAFDRARQIGVDMNFVGSVFFSEENNPKKAQVGDEIRELDRWQHRCLAPWSRAVVGVDGNVRICYFHKEWDESVGNLIFESFDEIWNGEKAAAVRREFFKKGYSAYCEKENYCMFLGRV